jgi:hypothetical protein
MEFNRHRVEQSPPVDHAVRNLVSFAQFDKLVEEPSGDEIISTFLFKTAYLGRDVAYPLASVVPHLVIGVCKNKPFVEFPLKQGRQSVNRDFDPLGKQDIDILDEHFKTSADGMEPKATAFGLSVWKRRAHMSIRPA